eukprot:scaffold38431_cov41-Prasinocladus_malaysianus.AAC.1
MRGLAATSQARSDGPAGRHDAMAEGIEAGRDIQDIASGHALGASSGLISRPFIWQEPFSRLFLGDKGSMTCLHVDLLPQLEFCHVLAGTKVPRTQQHLVSVSLRLHTMVIAMQEIERIHG